MWHRDAGRRPGDRLARRTGGGSARRIPPDVRARLLPGQERSNHDRTPGEFRAHEARCVVPVHARQPLGLRRSHPDDFLWPRVFQIRASIPDAAHHQDILPTLASVLKLPLPATITGHALTSSLSATAPPRRRVSCCLLVLDATRADYLDKHAAGMPTLSRLRKEGVWYPNARVNYLPSATAVAHATISTGTDPRFHGIVVNAAYDRLRDRASEPYFEQSPANLMMPTLADLWSRETRGRAVIYAQGGLFYAAAALAGHGACFWDGRTVMAVTFRRGQRRLGDQSRVLSDARIVCTSMDARTLWEGTSGRWLNHDIANTVEVRRSALFPAFEARAVMSVIEHESDRCGRDPRSRADQSQVARLGRP